MIEFMSKLATFLTMFAVWLGVLAVPTLLAAACAGAAVRKRSLGWATLTALPSCFAILVIVLFVPRLMIFGEQYDIARAVGVDIRSTTGSFPAGYFVDQIVVGQTRRVDVQELMAFAKARYHCSFADRSPQPFGVPSGSAAYAERYRFFSDRDPISILGPISVQVNIWYGESDVVVDAHIVDSVDDTAQAMQCLPS